MKHYFILLTSGLIVRSESKAVFQKFPTEDYWKVCNASILSSGGELLRIVPEFFITSSSRSIAARWDEFTPAVDTATVDTAA